MKVQLKVITGAKAGQMIPINLPQFLIGRAEDCQLKPRSELISRYHCAIISEEGYVAVRDLGSKNGIYHNGSRVVLEQELKNGDRLKIGPLEFEIVLTVALKGVTKSKVGSVADVVNRIVEQSASPAGRETVKSTLPTEERPNDSGDITDWLMSESDSESNDEETQSFNMEVDDVFNDLKKESDEQKKKEDATAAEKEEKGPKKPAPAGNTSDAAANLLKNFFKGNR